jgi:hypothetical protein
MFSNAKSIISGREAVLVVGAFVLAAFLFISFSVWATTIGTNIDATGTLGAATSTPWGTLAVEQRAAQNAGKPVFVVGDTGTTTPFIFVSQKGVVGFGSSSPSPLFLNAGDVVVGDNGSTNDVYISGGLGVANATTSDGDLVVGTGSAGGFLSFTNNGRLVVGASTTALTATGAPNKFVFDGGNSVFSSGGTGTTTLSILTEAGADGANSCIEMSNDGLTYTLMINGAGTGVLVSQGSCDD